NLSLTNGSPYGSTQLAAMHVYQQAFLARQYGIGQAEAIVLFIVVAIVTVTQVLLAKRYEVEA
ncbi:MAG: sugar ABC transporter permease, partial [Sedimentisphaerales bacterium]|nr:sugar ABC transporter permease [Sedimentisphaerales bacterium]